MCLGTEFPGSHHCAALERINNVFLPISPLCSLLSSFSLKGGCRLRFPPWFKFLNFIGYFWMQEEGKEWENDHIPLRARRWNPQSWFLTFKPLFICFLSQYFPRSISNKSSCKCGCPLMFLGSHPSGAFPDVDYMLPRERDCVHCTSEVQSQVNWNICCSFQPVFYSLFFRDLLKGTNHCLMIAIQSKLPGCIWQCPSSDSPFLSPAPSPSCVLLSMYSGRTTEWGEGDKNNLSLEEYRSPSRVVPCTNNMGAVTTHMQER